MQLETERFILRQLNAEHAPTLQAYLTRNEPFFRPSMPTWADNFLSLENLERQLQEQWFAMHKRQMLRLFIFHRSDKAFRYILGDITYSNIVMGPFQSCFLGYKIDEKACNKGIATEALFIANAFAFAYFGLHRIEANIMPSNLASLRVVEKLGFEREGLSKKLLKINGNWEDHYRYALLDPKIE